VKRRDSPTLENSANEMVDLLTDLGMDHKLAKVLAHLSQVEESKSTDIERECELRQPEVSLATKDLRARGWVVADERRQGGKGRPVHYYRLELPLPEIMRQVEAQKLEEIGGELQKIERLKALVSRAD